MITTDIEHEGGMLPRELGWEDDEDRIEADHRLPRLDVDPADLENANNRRLALHRLDELLNRLEQANLAERQHPPPTVIEDLGERGLATALGYTIPQLIEIVFKTQALLMAARAPSSAVPQVGLSK